MSKESAFEIGRLYQPIKAIADTLVASQKDVFVRLPGLVGYWPMGMRSAGNVIEHSGSGLNLTQTGTCPTDYDGNSFVHLGDGVNYVWNSSSQLSLTGTATWISSTISGLTIGCWVNIDALPSVQGGIAGKFGVITNWAYVIDLQSSGVLQFVISGTGSNLIVASGPAIGTSEWVFVCGRFTPSTEAAVFINAVKVVNTTAVPASLNVSTQAFEVGRYLNDNTYTAHVRVRDLFICASALSDAVIEQIRATSAP